MKRRNLIPLSLTLAVLAIGSMYACGAWQWHQVAQCLPPGVTLDFQVVSGPLIFPEPTFWLFSKLGLNRDGVPRLPTLEEELNRVGAYSREGKLFTVGGQEIAFLVEDDRTDYEAWKFGEKYVITVVPPDCKVPIAICH